MRKNMSFKFFLSTSIVFSLMFFTIGSSFAREIDDIRLAIKSRNVRWSADETTIHRLSLNERKMRVGLNRPTLAVRVQQQATYIYLLSAPSGTFDWRNNGGTNYITPVKDQGQCGSCWAFATTGALESYTLINDSYNSGLNLSEQTLLSCSGAGSCSGGYIDQASTFIKNTGLPADSLYSYNATNGSCSNAGLNWRNSTEKIAVWKWVNTGAPDVATIKNAVFTYGPLVTTMNVYSDFYSYRSGVYSQVYGTIQGGHAILIIGYADDSSIPGGGYFIVKNSWGTGWGESFGSQPGGYFRIAYGELNSPVNFGAYTIAYDSTSSYFPPCAYSINPRSNSFAYGGGSGNIGVTAGSTCAWTAKSSGSWLSIVSGSSGTGSANISYSVSANTSSSPRTGTITLTDNNATVVSTFAVTQQTQNTYSLSGTVRAGSSSGPGLAGATVSIAGKTATTSSTGFFSITGIAAGTCTLVISKPGYTSYTNNAYAISANKILSIYLKQLTYSLSGTVRSGSSSGPTLAGATVSIAGKGAISSSRGAFTITGIAFGTYKLGVSKPGFVTFTNAAYSISSNQTLSLYLLRR